MMLFVGGTFDKNIGRPSGIVRTISSVLTTDYDGDVMVINGGSLDELEDINFANYSPIVWMPNIDNSEDKMLSGIKRENPHAVLVSSKNVYDKEYTEWDVVGRLLASRSNLGFMIRKEEGQFHIKLLDPLGNMYCDTTDMDEVGKALCARLTYLGQLSRCSSKNVGQAKHHLMDDDFMTVVRRTADEFSGHVNANNPNRMLGNASTRCMSGFPAMRTGGRIFVTRRNIDKKTIASSGFIETRLAGGDRPGVEYFGDVKPSVDTPVQLMLFDHFPEVRYMIHGHVYVVGAPFTHTKIPCGYLEEFNEIVEVVDENRITSESSSKTGDRAPDNFAINLLGHGCIVLASDLSYFDEIDYMSRPLPEAG